MLGPPLVHQEYGETVEMLAFERELRVIEEGSIEEENLLEGLKIRETSSPTKFNKIMAS